MIRLLIFVEPKPLPEDLFRNQSWVTFPLQLASFLHRDNPGEFEISLALPRRFRHLAQPFESVLEDRIYVLDEQSIMRVIHDHGVTLRRAWNAEFLAETPHELHHQVDQLVSRAIPSRPWDAVISFGEPCRYSFASQRLRLNMETSPFGRYPFQPSFFLDHCGMFRQAAPQTLFADRPYGAPSPVAQQIRDQAWAALSDQQSIRFQRRFERYLLLPLQASNYSSFDAQGPYDTQIDYLFDICGQVPSDMGVVVTEHPQINSIDRGNQFALTCQSLRDLFPNVVYLPRAKCFSSASFYLLPQVDAVWTLASNVGPVASFFGLPVGSTPHSHLSYAADVGTVGALQALLRQSGQPSPRVETALHPVIATGDNESAANAETDHSPIRQKLVFEWMFGHYLIPWNAASRPGWLADYLRQRIEGFRRHGESIESFCPTQFSTDDFLAADVRRGPVAVRSHVYQQLVTQEVTLYRNFQSWHLRQTQAQGKDATFVLINDTAKLETYRHLGCNRVSAFIQRQMQTLGFRQLYSLNGRDEIPPHISATPDWAIINGEGSFHHNSCRIKELLELALEYKARGSKVALINSIWEQNAPHLAEPLRQFDVIAVRDQSSRDALDQLGISALWAPDLSLPMWREPRDCPASTLLVTDNIVYRRALALLDIALILGGDYVLLDDRQISRLNDDGVFSALPERRVSCRLLNDHGRLQSARMVITGRFHVAVACVALQTPFVYVESNTNKISSLCDDVGLPRDLLNVTDAIEQGDWLGIQSRLSMVAREFPGFQNALAEYYDRGLMGIDRLFSLIKI